MSRYYIQPIDPAELSSRFSTDDTINPIHGLSEDWANPRLDKIKAVLDRLPDRETDLIRLYFFMNKKQMEIAEIFGVTQAAVSYRIKRALDRIRFLIDMPDLDKFDIYEYLSPVMPTTLDSEIFREMYETTCQSEVAKRLDITQGRVRHRFIKNLRHLGEVVLDRYFSWVDTLPPGLFEAKELRRKFEDIAEAAPDLEDEEFENRLLSVYDYVEDLPETLYPRDVQLFASIYRVFVRIRYNFNILREVKLPKWSNRARKTIV